MNDPRRSPSIFARGAVDLSALRTGPADSASVSKAPAAGSDLTADGPAGTGNAQGGVSVIDVSEATFQSEVLERSMETPVIVDFWAAWCEPCKQLSPLLEKLAVEADGAWVLAKVDVDANQRLAQMFRVQGIPLVYAIVGGQPVDAFNGVIPERQLRQWIDAVCRTAGVEVEPTEDPQLTLADDALSDGDLDGAERAYQEILTQTPTNAEAHSGIAQIGLLRRTAGVDSATALSAARAAPADVAAQTLAADVEMLSGQAAAAFERLIDLVRRTGGDDREVARKHLLSLFVIAGPDDPVVATARRALANALF